MKKSGKDAFFWTKRLEKAEISLRPSIFANFTQSFCLSEPVFDAVVLFGALAIIPALKRTN
jgi:hypothetical protein